MADNNKSSVVNSSSQKREVADERLDAKAEKDYEKNKPTISKLNTNKK